MRCRTVTHDGPSGRVTAIVCGDRTARPCAYCRKPSTKLCDGDMGEGRTCDRAMCEACTYGDGPDRDLCRQHRPASMAEPKAMRMPFGQYGPKHYPPDGLEIEQIPSDYLRWCLNSMSAQVRRRFPDVIREIENQLRMRIGGTSMRAAGQEGD